MKSILMLSLFVFSFPVYANLFGADSSGGGKVVVCRDQNQVIKSIQLLDLYEASALYGLSPKMLAANIDASLEVVKAKLREVYKDTSFMSPTDHWIDDAKKAFRLLPKNSVLESVNDAAVIALPAGCQTEQLALYKDDFLLLVNQDLWNVLDDLNKAALYVHEAIYRFERTGNKTTNSVHARKLVGHLFSDFKLTPVMEGIPEKAQSCFGSLDGKPGSVGFFFYMYDSLEESSTTANMQFIIYRNMILNSKIVIEVTRLPWVDIFSQSPSIQSNFETYKKVVLIKDETSTAPSKTYYFDEPDGKYFIQCGPRG